MTFRKIFVLFLVIMFLNACSFESKKEKSTVIKTNAADTVSCIKDKVIDQKLNNKPEVVDSSIIRLINRADTSLYHYHYILKDSVGQKLLIFTGYLNYNNNEFDNPAYLEVYKNNDKIYSDSFEGYADISLKNLEGYFINDSIHFFTLEFGLDACDYIKPVRLYYISDGKIDFVNESSSQSTDYASRYIEYRFPQDAGGIENYVMIIEKINYKTGEEPDVSDTIYYMFDKGNFIKTE